jgi:hypothetical protein
LTARLTWADTSLDLDLYLAVAACTDLYSGSCTIVASSTASRGGSEEITRTVAAGESYAIFVDNLDPTRPQGYTITITIS